MQMFTRNDLTLLFRVLAERMGAEQDYLAELDGEIGATTGPLYASALLHAAKLLGQETEIPLARLPEVVVAISEGVAARGLGKPGDKTMLDAWAPAAHVARAGLMAGQDVLDTMTKAAQAAAEGAEATRAMMAAKGRAARLGPRSLGHLDPGAASAAALLDSMAQWVAAKAGRSVQ